MQEEYEEECRSYNEQIGAIEALLRARDSKNASLPGAHPAAWLQGAAIIGFPGSCPQILLAQSRKLCIYSAHKWYKYSIEGDIVMKKLSVVLVVVLSLCLVVSLAFAADMKGTVKSVDAKAGSLIIIIDGKDTTYKADKAWTSARSRPAIRWSSPLIRTS